MKSRYFAMPLLFATIGLGSIHGSAYGQVLPAPPTYAQGVAADTRTGSVFNDNGVSIFYQDSGGTGTPLVLIHGYPLSGALFQYQQLGLTAKFRVITLDLPGFGRSSSPPGFGGTELGTTAVYAKFVLDLINHLGINQAIIGGHSMGGFITQEIYHEAPQRFLGMILIDTAAIPASLAEEAEWYGYGIQGFYEGPSSFIDMITPQLLTGDTRNGNAIATMGIEDIIAEGSVEGAVAGSETLQNRPDYTPQLASIAVPVLVIEGIEDPVYGFPVAMALSQQVPHGTLALIPAASHASIYENPGAANTAIESWAASSGF